MYTLSPWVLGVHIRQTTNAHGITVMCYIAPPLASCMEVAQARKCVSLQAHCIYREGCWGFHYNKLSVHYIYSKGYTHFNCGFWYHFALQI